MRKYIIFAFLLALTACGGSSDNSTSTTTLQGTAAEGLAIESALVTFTDKDGNTVTPAAEVMTDASGNYSATFESAFPVPLIVTIVSSTGSLKTIVDDATQTTVNINPVTNFVADKVIEEVGLDNVSSGTFEAEGTRVVEAAFGEGVNFDVFSSDVFVAQNTSNSTEPTPADVILDALADSADGVGIDTLLNTAIDDEKPLLEQIEFQIDVAKAVTNITLSEPLASIVSDNAETEVAISFIDIITTVIEATKSNLDISDSGLNEEEQAVVLEQLLDMTSELISNVNEDVDAEGIEQFFKNTDALFTEKLVEAVTNIDENSSLKDVIEGVSDKIIVTIEDNDIDLGAEDVVSLPESVTSIIDETINNPTETVENTNWNIAHWDELVWQ